MVDHLIKFAELFLCLPFRTLGLSLSIAFDDLLASEKLFVARFFVWLRLPGHTMFLASQHLLAVFFLLSIGYVYFVLSKLRHVIQSTKVYTTNNLYMWGCEVHISCGIRRYCCCCCYSNLFRNQIDCMNLWEYILTLHHFNMLQCFTFHISCETWVHIGARRKAVAPIGS